MKIRHDSPLRSRWMRAAGFMLAAANLTAQPDIRELASGMALCLAYIGGRLAVSPGTPKEK